MVVVTVADHYDVHDGYVGEVAWNFCISFWAHPREGRAAVLEDGIE